MSVFDQVVKGTDTRTWFRRIIQACTGGGVLLTRYHIFDNRWFGVYLHHLQQSDEDRACHDHPWAFVSILLTGGYWEHVPAPLSYVDEGPKATWSTWYPRWSVLRRPAEWQHRLELPHPVWTLVLRGPERRVWGFWPDNQFMHHVEYGNRFCEPDEGRM